MQISVKQGCRPEQIEILLGHEVQIREKNGEAPVAASSIQPEIALCAHRA
jgi:hypothetical protein